MKREILCKPCDSKLFKSHGITKETDPISLAEMMAMGEGEKRVNGTLTVSVYCDSCGTELVKGTPAVAHSIYNDYAPYYEWEHEFMEE